MNIAGQKSNKGFTLIEILVVIAISMILMGLVLYPVVQSFKMTRSAQAMVDAQDAARHAMDIISRDLGEAMDILHYDNAQPIQIPVVQPNGIEYLDAPDAKIDLVLPKMLVHCNNPNHPVDSTDPNTNPRDFERGDEALPTCKACATAGEDATDVEIRPKLPMEQDTKVVRYFLGLMYNNPNPADNEPACGWSSPWGKNVEADQGNQVVLYRVEFDPNDPELLSDEIPTSLLNQYDGNEVLANLCDPQFFYRSDTWQAWARKARVIGVAKYEDLVDGIKYENDDDDDYDALDPLVTFKFKKVDNDIFNGTYATDQGFEYPDTAPAVFNSEYGYWLSNYDLALYRYTYGEDGSEPQSTAVYKLTFSGNNNLVIDKELYDENGDPVIFSEFRQFNLAEYLANGELSSDGPGSYLEMAFVPDSVRGTVNFALKPRKPRDAYSISDLPPDEINTIYHNEYSADRGSAIRYAHLSTFKENNENYLKYATIVPGSERVVGPDMTVGSNGDLVTYERVPFALGEAGLNQYRINYDTGYIFFSPVYDQDLPVKESVDGSPMPIRVDYKVHFNHKNDVVRGGYQTRAAVVVHLGMRMYDPESSKPHSVDLSSTIKVRNQLR